MKKLTRANVDELKATMPVLDEAAQRLVFGGSGDVTTGSDCVFQSMNWLYHQMGGQIEDVTVESISNMYYANADQSNPGDGMLMGHLDEFYGRMFNYNKYEAECVPKNRADYEGFMIDTKNCCGFMMLVSGGEHAVNLLDLYVDDKGCVFYNYIDPQNSTSGFIKGDSVLSIYGVTGFAPRVN